MAEVPFREIMKAIALRLAVIDGLIIHDHPVVTISDSPAAVVGFPAGDYHVTAGASLMRWDVPVRIYVAMTDPEAASTALMAFVAQNGASSVRQAIEDTSVDVSGVFSDTAWEDATVTVARVGEMGGYTFGSIEYLGCEWTIELLAR
jgi:hypothetical protein